MSFHKSICYTSPKKFDTNSIPKSISQIQAKNIRKLIEIYITIKFVLEKVYSKQITTVKIQLIEQNYKDLLVVYNSIFNSSVLTFLDDYHPCFQSSIAEVEPWEAIDWFDYYQNEVTEFGKIIGKLSELNIVKLETIAPEVTNLVKQTKTKLGLGDDESWSLFDNKIKKSLQNYMRHWMKGNFFYYRKDNGEIENIHFEKSVKGKSYTGLEFFKILYESYAKDKNTSLTSGEIRTILDERKIIGKSQANTLKSNFMRKIEGTEINKFIEIVCEKGGYRLLIKE